MKPLKDLVVFVLLWTLFAVFTVGIGLILLPVYWALVVRGSELRAEEAAEKLRSTLMQGETLLHSALQGRAASLLSRRRMIAITPSRIIAVSRPLLGGFSMVDYQWKDLHDVRLSENVLPQWFGSRLVFQTAKGTVPADGIDGPKASEIYAYAQQQEQAWEEKRRVRHLEERRASSGGIVMQGAASTPGAAGGTLVELEKAKQLLDSGIISDAEFHEIKAKLLSGGTF